MVEPTNKVDESVNFKGESSYYHAHIREEDKLDEQKRITSGGAPILITSEQSRVFNPVVVQITKFSWSDSRTADKVTVYVPFDEDVNPASVSCNFLPRSLVLTYTYSDREIRRLTLVRLSRDIIPDQSSFKVRNCKIILYLKKTKIEEWPLLEFRN